MKRIALTRGKLALVDDEDYKRINQWKWCAKFRFGNWYAVRGQWDGERVKEISMHREIINAPHRKCVDHKDGDGLNNQRDNLRICTMAENNKNAKISKTNTSGFKGVSPSQTFGKWIASITIENKTKYLGTFKSRTDAAHAYDSYALEHYGEFAKPNFA